MTVITFATPDEQAQGALSLPAPLDPDLVLYFPNVGPYGGVHGAGLNEPLRVYFLDHWNRILQISTIKPMGMMAKPAGTVSFVETSALAAMYENFDFLD